MNGFPIIRGGLAVCALLILSGSAVTSGPLYNIIDLGTLGGLTSVALGINNLGQVAGGADLANGKRHAFLWQNGTMTDLGTLPGANYSEAWDINNLGVVCGGSSGSGAAWTPFVWDSGTMTQLPHLSGVPTGDSIALAVNDAGQVVGNSNNFPVLWENGVTTDLFTTYGLGFTWDISNNHLVAGGRKLVNLVSGVVTDLGTLGGNSTAANGVNSAGQVTGGSKREPGTAPFHAFLWQSGSMTDISLLGGFDNSSAEAINAFGQVVGIGGWVGSGPPDYPFLYVPGVGLQNLETIIPAGSGWSGLSPRDINDAGQIVGYGTINGNPRAFLMTSVPIPALSSSAMIFLILLMILLGSYVIRRQGVSCIP